MKLRNLLLLICPFLILIFFISTQMMEQENAAAQPKPGVVVEKVMKNSEAEKAGIKAQDILLNWSRADLTGQFESPFDLTETEIEEAPHGNVTLVGVRGTEQRSWEVGPDIWGIEARPDFQGKLLDIYLEGQELLESGKVIEAAEHWRAAAQEAQNAERTTTAPWLLLHTAQMLASQRQYREADEAYQAAAHISGESSLVMAQLFHAWADSCYNRNNWDDAEKYYQRALLEGGKSGADNLIVALNLNSMGNLISDRGDLARAKAQYAQALEIRQKLAPGSLVVASSLSNLGLIAWSQGDFDKAVELHRRALEIRQKLAPGSNAVASSLNNLALVATDLGDLDKADDYLLDSLAIRNKNSPEGLDVATNFNNLGNVASARGDLAKAENYYRQGLIIQEKLAPVSLDAARSYLNLGVIAHRQGDSSKAQEYFLQALNMQEKLARGSLELSASLMALGNIAGERGDLTTSELYHQQALAIRQKLAPGSLLVAMSWINLGEVARRRRNPSLASTYYNQALAITEKISPDGTEAAQCLQSLGWLADERHDPALAEKYFRRALAIREKLKPGSTDHAESLGNLASVLAKTGQSEAAHLFQQALDALETQTMQLGGSQEVRSEFRARYSNYYKAYIDLLMAQKRPEEAFHVAERWRARSLLETLALAQVDIHHGADPALMQRERSLQASMNAKHDRRIRLLTGQQPKEQVKAVEQEIKGLLAEYDEVESKIKATSPAYAALTRPQPLTSTDVQRILGDDTLLLEYSLGKERSYLWALTSTTFTAHILPSRAAIEATARSLHKLLSTSKQTETAEDQATNQRRARLRTTAAAMSHMILEPLAEQIKGKRLLIVADGALQYIPFALLPHPAKPGGRPLILEHEIVYSPSASVLAELRREATGRKPAPKAVAVLADPVFNSKDPRVQTHGRNPSPGATKQAKQRTAKTTRVDRSATDVGLVDLSRLPYTRREADAIMAVTPVGQGLEATGFQASRSTATSHDLAQYRVVHFATHGLSDNLHPEFSGLVLSMVDQKGKPQNGFLDLQDIYNLNLPADLVVLSACETALGKEIQGEGIVGLTRGFMYAGATRVVASLWNTDDVSTKELMEKFYRAMEQDKIPPTAALRSAQVAMWKQRRWRDPYYWAAFQIQGEWR